MRQRTAVILAAILIAGIVGLQVLEVVMRAAVNQWISQGVVIPVYGRVLLGVAVFWATFRWLLAVPVLGAFVLLALLARREGKGARA